MIFGISFGKKKTSQQSSTDTNIKENTNQSQSQSTTGQTSTNTSQTGTTNQSTTGTQSSDTVDRQNRSEEHTSELQSLMRISYAVFCLKKKTKNHHTYTILQTNTQQ